MRTTHAPSATRNLPITRAGIPAAPAVFVSPHQDDELLFMGAAIREHVARGRDVRVLLIGRGNKSSVRTRPCLQEMLDRTPCEKEFGAVRDREFEWSVRGLGATPIIPTWEDRLDENASTPADVAAIIRKHAPSGSDLKTVSEYRDEYHSDHFACHDAVASLFAGGWTDMPPRYYTLCFRKQAVLDAGLRVVREGVSTPIAPEHQEPYKFVNVEESRWGVGYTSVRKFFSAQARDPFSYRVVEAEPARLPALTTSPREPVAAPRPAPSPNVPARARGVLVPGA